MPAMPWVQAVPALDLLGEVAMLLLRKARVLRPESLKSKTAAGVRKYQAGPPHRPAPGRYQPEGKHSGLQADGVALGSQRAAQVPCALL
jgi:hypothetical protein